jgi:hypothetical protein
LISKKVISNSEFGKGGSYETFIKKLFDWGFNTHCSRVFPIRLCNPKRNDSTRHKTCSSRFSQATANVSPPSSPSPSKPTEVSQPTAQRTTEIVLLFVNLRQGPSMDSKIISVLKKGTKLTVLEEKAGWLRVRLGDGMEGWVAKAMTTEGTQPKSP